MLSSTPTFPPLERWQAMSEAEQDALIARMEMTQRFRRSLRRLLLSIIGATITAAVSTVLYAQLLN